MWPVREDYEVVNNSAIDVAVQCRIEESCFDANIFGACGGVGDFDETDTLGSGADAAFEGASVDFGYCVCVHRWRQNNIFDFLCPLYHSLATVRAG